MFETIKRWFGNLAWLLNHPPTSFTGGALPEGTKCAYCGRGPEQGENALFYFPALGWAYCHFCQKKIFDAVYRMESEFSTKDEI
jgi:hypothetical protein